MRLDYHGAEREAGQQLPPLHVEADQPDQRPRQKAVLPAADGDRHRRKQDHQHLREIPAGDRPERHEIECKRRGGEEEIADADRQECERREQEVVLRRIGPGHEAGGAAGCLHLHLQQGIEMIDLVEIAAPDMLRYDVEGIEVGELAIRPAAEACEPEGLEDGDRRQRRQHEADIGSPLRWRGLNRFQRLGKHERRPWT
ncbi:hypothetical protein ACVWXN_009526 [Bradyrhizobium sp. i1.4.4]